MCVFACYTTAYGISLARSASLDVYGNWSRHLRPSGRGAIRGRRPGYVQIVQRPKCPEMGYAPDILIWMSYDEIGTASMVWHGLA